MNQMSSSLAPAAPKPGIPVMLMPFLMTQNSCDLSNDVLKIRRIRVQTFRELGPFHAGGAVAIDAAVLGKFASAGLHFGGIVQTGGRLIVRMANDRIGADLDQRPMYDRRIFLAAGNVIKTAEEIDRGGDGDNDCK